MVFLWVCARYWIYIQFWWDFWLVRSEIARIGGGLFWWPSLGQLAPWCSDETTMWKAPEVGENNRDDLIFGLIFVGGLNDQRLSFHFASTILSFISSPRVPCTKNDCATQLREGRLRSIPNVISGLLTTATASLIWRYSMEKHKIKMKEQ